MFRSGYERNGTGWAASSAFFYRRKLSKGSAPQHPPAGASLSQTTDFFSPDYRTARQRFLEAAHAAGAACQALPLDARGPAGEALTIDIAWLGHPSPRRALVHTSGLHGVEAFAGSAIQLRLLAQPPVIRSDGALVLVHVLNPFGMAWLRRANENNVDLNRNFLKRDEAWSGAPELYRRIDSVLNPASPPGFDFFRLRAAWLALRHGFRALEQAVAKGQYEFPRGLFYGGKRLEDGPRAYLEWLAQSVSDVQYLFALDVHTGLGAWGGETLMLEPGVRATAAAVLSAALDRPLIDPLRGDPAPYAIRGGLGGILPTTLPTTRVDFLLQELGTYRPMRVFAALRDENRWHHYGNGDLSHPAKRRLREALCPGSPDWRQRVLARGVSLALAAAAWTFNNISIQNNGL